MKKKVISLLICSALMMVEGVTYAQTMASEPSNNSKIESSASVVSWCGKILNPIVA